MKHVISLIAAVIASVGVVFFMSLAYAENCAYGTRSFDAIRTAYNGPAWV